MTTYSYLFFNLVDVDFFENPLYKSPLKNQLLINKKWLFKWDFI